MARPSPDDGPPPASNGDALPRYRQILDVLRKRIEDGTYPLGANLPTESELCAEFATSRYTVREALRRLVELELVSRRQGSGTVVVATEPAQGFVQSMRSLSDLFNYAYDTHYELISMGMVTAAPELRDTLGSGEGTRWLLLNGMRLTKPGGTPICYIASYVPERLAFLRSEFIGYVGPFYSMIEKKAKEPIVEASQEIKAETMPSVVADALGVPRGGIAMRLLRRYRSARGILIASFNWHPAEQFVYRMQLNRRSES